MSKKYTISTFYPRGEYLEGTDYDSSILESPFRLSICEDIIQFIINEAGQNLVIIINYESYSLPLIISLLRSNDVMYMYIHYTDEKYKQMLVNVILLLELGDKCELVQSDVSNIPSKDMLYIGIDNIPMKPPTRGEIKEYGYVTIKSNRLKRDIPLPEKNNFEKFETKVEDVDVKMILSPFESRYLKEKYASAFMEEVTPISEQKYKRVAVFKLPGKGVTFGGSKDTKSVSKGRPSEVGRSLLKKRDESSRSQSRTKSESASPKRSKSKSISPERNKPKAKSKSVSVEKSQDFGIIFHWGLYSVPAYDDRASVLRRKMYNGSEWYAKRLSIEEGAYRPLSGWQETQAYHAKHYKDKEYSDFAKEFPPKDWNPDEWMKVCVEAGAQYVILTAKHHDGYCLWPTSTGPSSKVDLIQKFKESALRHGLTFGLYYSWMEFEAGCTVDYFKKVVEPQMKELMKYKPDIWWFDGSWECKSKYTLETIQKLCEQIHKSNPKALINDRLGEKYKDINDLGMSADYRVYEDRTIPEKKPTVPWEHINTIGYSWGRNKQQKEEDYKSVRILEKLYDQVHDMGGRFLLNLGPDADGELDPTEVKRLLGLGEYIKQERKDSSVKTVEKKGRKHSPDESPSAKTTQKKGSRKQSSEEEPVTPFRRRSPSPAKGGRAKSAPPTKRNSPTSKGGEYIKTTTSTRPDKKNVQSEVPKRKGYKGGWFEEYNSMLTFYLYGADDLPKPSEDIDRASKEYVKELKQYIIEVLSLFIDDEKAVQGMVSDELMDLWIGSFTHESYDINKNYESTELVGDSCLSYNVKSLLYNKDRTITASELTIINSKLTDKPFLRLISWSLNMDAWVRMGGNSVSNTNVAEDVFESFCAILQVAGSYYLEERKETSFSPGQGIKYLYQFIDFLFGQVVLSPTIYLKDSKTALLQSSEVLVGGLIDPTASIKEDYSISEVGPNRVHVHRLGLSFSDLAMQFLRKNNIKMDKNIVSVEASSKSAAIARAYSEAIKELERRRLSLDRLNAMKEQAKWDNFDSKIVKRAMNKVQKKYGKDATLRFHIPKGLTTETSSTVLLLAIIADGTRRGRREILLSETGGRDTFKTKEQLLRDYAE